MKKLLYTLAAVLLVSAPLAAWAGVSPTASTPATSDPIPTPLTDAQPVILGHVVGTTSHSATVSTPDAERIVFEFDSRTVMPRQLIEGTPVRVEFHLMPNGMHHAGRITPLERGSNDWTRLEEMRTSALEGSDSRMQNETATEPDAMATNVTPANDGSATTTDDTNVLSDNTTRDANGTANAAENTETTPSELPQTASDQPWLLAFGAAAAAVAVGLSLRRRQV